MSRPVMSEGTVWILCDDESHPSKTARIERMSRDARGWHGMGFVLAASTRAAKTEAERRGRKSVVPKRESAEDTWKAPKYNLRCDLCGYELRATQERLSPIFDVLEHAAIPSITLTALAARLA